MRQFLTKSSFRITQVRTGEGARAGAEAGERSVGQLHKKQKSSPKSRKLAKSGVGTKARSEAEDYLYHPVDVRFWPSIGSLAGQTEGFSFLDCLCDRRLLLEVVEDGRPNKD